MNGVIVMDKPVGQGSNRMLGALKRLLGVKKMGFLGTLDPLATGVLPVFVGKATKLISAFEGLEKEYLVTLRLGERTDTFDAEGRILETRPLDGLEGAAVAEAVLSFAGTHEQEVPSFSAVKIGGTPAYRLARAGLPVPRRSRTVRLSGMEIERVCLPEVAFRVTCTSGTYMRSLAEAIGQKTGVGAHVIALRRIRCGNLFTLRNSSTLVEIEDAVASGHLAFLRNPSDFMPEYVPIMIGKDCEQRLKNGQPIPLTGAAPLPAPSAKLKAVGSGGTLIAIGEAVQARQRDTLLFQPKKVLI